MGWSIEIELSEPISEGKLDKILRTILARGPFGISKQPWGWTHDVDVRLEGASIRLSGSFSCSGRIAEKFASDLARLLESVGYETKIGPMR